MNWTIAANGIRLQIFCRRQSWVVGNPIHTAEADATQTRQFCRVWRGGVNWLLSGVRSRRTGLNWSAFANEMCCYECCLVIGKTSSGGMTLLIYRAGQCTEGDNSFSSYLKHNSCRMSRWPTPCPSVICAELLVSSRRPVTGRRATHTSNTTVNLRYTGWAKKWGHELTSIILSNRNWFTEFFSLKDSLVNMQWNSCLKWLAIVDGFQ